MVSHQHFYIFDLSPCGLDALYSSERGQYIGGVSLAVILDFSGFQWIILIFWQVSDGRQRKVPTVKFSWLVIMRPLMIPWLLIQSLNSLVHPQIDLDDTKIHHPIETWRYYSECKIAFIRKRTEAHDWVQSSLPHLVTIKQGIIMWHLLHTVDSVPV